MSLSDFEFGKKLGKGSFGSVWLVKRKEDNNIYAMKRVTISGLGKKERENALNEIRLIASLNHKNIIGYKEAFYDEKSMTLNIVMEYADDGDLSSKIKYNIKNHLVFEESTIWKILIQLLEGLKYLNTKKIMHRDLKSANLFLTKKGVLKIGDLNVSKIAKLGMAVTQIGTPFYAAPEIWQDKAYDYKCDIWSCGVIIYEIATLRTPFRGTSLNELYQNILHGSYIPISNRYSDDLHKIISYMLQVDPYRRYNIDELLNSDIIKRKIKEYGLIDNNNNVNNDQKDMLMKTIKLPRNMREINLQLPHKKYEEKNKIKEEMLSNDEYEITKQTFFKTNQFKISGLKEIVENAKEIIRKEKEMEKQKKISEIEEKNDNIDYNDFLEDNNNDNENFNDKINDKKEENENNIIKKSFSIKEKYYSHKNNHKSIDNQPVQIKEIIDNEKFNNLKITGLNNKNSNKDIHKNKDEIKEVLDYNQFSKENFNFNKISIKNKSDKKLEEIKVNNIKSEFNLLNLTKIKKSDSHNKDNKNYNLLLNSNQNRYIHMINKSNKRPNTSDNNINNNYKFNFNNNYNNNYMNDFLENKNYQKQKEIQNIDKHIKLLRIEQKQLGEKINNYNIHNNNNKYNFLDFNNNKNYINFNNINNNYNNFNRPQSSNLNLFKQVYHQNYQQYNGNLFRNNNKKVIYEKINYNGKGKDRKYFKVPNFFNNNNNFLNNNKKYKIEYLNNINGNKFNDNSRIHRNGFGPQIIIQNKFFN
jgi:NIMA (never in mitosis gene a)-related kinase